MDSSTTNVAYAYGPLSFIEGCLSTQTIIASLIANAEKRTKADVNIDVT
jgi:hypothetical protein